MASVHDFEVISNAGKPESLSKYKGQVALVVNVASK